MSMTTPPRPPRNLRELLDELRTEIATLKAENERILREEQARCNNWAKRFRALQAAFDAQAKELDLNTAARRLTALRAENERLTSELECEFTASSLAGHGESAICLDCYGESQAEGRAIQAKLAAAEQANAELRRALEVSDIKLITTLQGEIAALRERLAEATRLIDAEVRLAANALTTSWRIEALAFLASPPQPAEGFHRDDGSPCDDPGCLRPHTRISPQPAERFVCKDCGTTKANEFSECVHCGADVEIQPAERVCVVCGKGDLQAYAHKFLPPKGHTFQPAATGQRKCSECGTGVAELPGYFVEQKPVCFDCFGKPPSAGERSGKNG